MLLIVCRPIVFIECNIGSVERGERNITINVMEKISKALKRPITDFFDFPVFSLICFKNPQQGKQLKTQIFRFFQAIQNLKFSKIFC